MARVTFLGLNMDIATEVQVIAAIRGLYPQLVSPTDSDNRAVQLVLKYIITEHVRLWAARSATADTPDRLADQARQQAVTTQQTAGDTASLAATVDIVPTATT